MFKLKSNRGSLLVEAIVVLGLIATFTPLLYKHVSDRRTDIDNINRANTLLYLQQKTEEWLEDPNNTTTTALAANGSATVSPSSISSTLAKFDGKYLIGIRREDVNGSPTYKALIVDKTDTGSDLKAGKVANLIGTSAGIYSAMDSTNAWGVNGVWQEQITNYFPANADGTSQVPTGSVVVSTEYSRSKEQQRLSDLLIDTDLDMGDYNIITKGSVDAGTIVARDKFCIGDPTDENNCVTKMSDIGGNVGACEAIELITECDVKGPGTACQKAAKQGLNTSCSAIERVYAYSADLPCAATNNGKHNIAYSDGSKTVSTYCGGTNYIINQNIEKISTASSGNSVADVYPSDTDYSGRAFGITNNTAGWYQIIMKGEAGYNTTSANRAGGAIIVANVELTNGQVLHFKRIKGGTDTSGNYGGSGVALYEGASDTPLLVAGGGASGTLGGGGINGGKCNNGTDATLCQLGYKITDTDTSATATGDNTGYCTDLSCNIATGGYYESGSDYGYGGTGSALADCPTDYTCKVIPGGNATILGSTYPTSYPASMFGNWEESTTAYGYASIKRCGTATSNSINDCPAACSSDSDCGSGYMCDFTTGTCSNDIDCSSGDAVCATHSTAPYCTENKCSDDECSASDSTNCTAAGKLCDTSTGKCEICLTSADCPNATPICNVNSSGNSCTTCSGSSTVVNAGCQEHNASTPYCVSGQCYVDSCKGLCSGTTPICSSGSCVPCTSGSQCASGYCWSTGECGATECNVDDDCTAGYTCDSSTKTCKSSGPVSDDPTNYPFTCCKWGTRDVCVGSGTVNWSTAQNWCGHLTGVTMDHAVQADSSMWNNTTDSAGNLYSSSICGINSGNAWLSYEASEYYRISMSSGSSSTTTSSTKSYHALCVSAPTCTAGVSDCPSGYTYCNRTDSSATGTCSTTAGNCAITADCASTQTCNTSTKTCDGPGCDDPTNYPFTCCKWGTRWVCISTRSINDSWANIVGGLVSWCTHVNMSTIAMQNRVAWGNTKNPASNSLSGICGINSGYAWTLFSDNRYWYIALSDGQLYWHATNEDYSHTYHALCISQN